MMDYEEGICNARAPYVRAQDTKNDDLDDLFYADALIGRIISFLAAVGVFCAFLALCFFIGYFK